MSEEVGSILLPYTLRERVPPRTSLSGTLEYATFAY